MLKIDGGHKVTQIGITKAGKPYIKLFISSWDKPQANGINKKQWVVAQVYFKQCNMTDIQNAFNNKEFNYAELGAYRITGIEHWIPQNMPNEVTYTIQVFADYVRFYNWDKDKKQEVKNDKIEYIPNQQPISNNVEIQDKEEDYVWSDKALEDNNVVDWDEDL